MSLFSDKLDIDEISDQFSLLVSINIKATLAGE